MNHILLLVNITWSALLGAAFAYMVYLIFRWLKCKLAEYDFYSNPESLTHILQCMIHTVDKDGDWKQLETMRGDVRVALRNLDKLRHDVSNKPLRESKRSSNSINCN